MIKVSCKEEKLRYNAYHLVKAFFPGEEALSEFAPEQEASVRIEFSENIIEISAKERREIDRELYEKLSRLSGRSLPWGTLLGVRPTKLASMNLDISREAFEEKMRSERLVSREKALLAYDIAVKEKGMIQKALARGEYSLYVGIPFCPSICSYCSFSSGAISAWKNSVEPYLEALCREVEEVSRELSGLKPVTVYIGGGTPTSLSAEQLDGLLSCITRNFDMGNLLEFTLEAGRPDSISEEKLRVMKDFGVTRISINPQSMQQKTLDAIGRRHSVGQVYEAFELARKAGFDNINMDMILALPGEGLDDVKDTLRQIRSLGPESLTVHSLAVKRDSDLNRNKTLYKPAEPLLAEKMAEAASEAAHEMGMEPYYLYRQKGISGNLENTGCSLPGRECFYNVLIMEEVSGIIACGAGAKSKVRLKEAIPDPGRAGKSTFILHSSNPKAIDEYIRRKGKISKTLKDAIDKAFKNVI